MMQCLSSDRCSKRPFASPTIVATGGFLTYERAVGQNNGSYPGPPSLSLSFPGIALSISRRGGLLPQFYLSFLKIF